MQFSILHCRTDCFSAHSSFHRCPKKARRKKIRVRRDKEKDKVRKTESPWVFRLEDKSWNMMSWLVRKLWRSKGKMRSYPSQNYAFSFITTAFGFVDCSFLMHLNASQTFLHRSFHCTRVMGCPERFSKRRKKIILSWSLPEIHTSYGLYSLIDCFCLKIIKTVIHWTPFNITSPNVQVNWPSRKTVHNDVEVVETFSEGPGSWRQICLQFEKQQLHLKIHLKGYLPISFQSYPQRFCCFKEIPLLSPRALFTGIS